MPTVDVARELADVMADVARTLHEPESVDEVVERLVHTAREVLPGVDFAGVSISRGTSVETVAATDGLVRRLDLVQYELDEGPCMDAMRQRTHAEAHDLRTENRWPRFAPIAVELGVISQMGIHIFADGPTVGGLNLYASRAGVFDEATRHVAELFAVHAGLALGQTMTLSHLNDALETRQIIGQAIGIIMQRYTLSEAMAFAYLSRVSQHSNTKLRTVAQTLVAQVGAEAANRVGGQHSD